MELNQRRLVGAEEGGSKGNEIMTKIRLLRGIKGWGSYSLGRGYVGRKERIKEENSARREQQ